MRRVTFYTRNTMCKAYDLARYTFIFLIDGDKIFFFLILSRDCTPDCLDTSVVKGKILVCNTLLPYVAYTKRAVAAIFEDDSDWAESHGLPLSGLQADDFESFLSYIKSAK